MGWVSAAVGLAGSLLGNRSQRRASRRATNAQVDSGRLAIEEQRRAGAEAQGYYAPYAGVGERGIEASNFLANPQAQFQYLQDNPLFQMSLDNANAQTNASAASRGRLSAGDTLQQLSNNVLLSATPLLDRQRQDTTNLMNYGMGVSSGQANAALGVGNNVSNLTTGIGNVQAAGAINQGNIQSQGYNNLFGGINGIGQGAGWWG